MPSLTMHAESGLGKRVSRAWSDMVDLRLRPAYRPGMHRRRFLLTSLAGAIAAPLAAVAQQRLPAFPPVCYAGEGGTIVPAGHGEHWARGADRRKVEARPATGSQASQDLGGLRQRTPMRSSTSWTSRMTAPCGSTTHARSCGGGKPAPGTLSRK
jgi:hypothetical protein